MSYPKRSLTLWVLALCLLLTMGVSPAFAKPQAASSDTSSDTAKKAKKSRKKSKATETVAEPASAAPCANSGRFDARGESDQHHSGVHAGGRYQKNQDGIRKFQSSNRRRAGQR